MARSILNPHLKECIEKCLNCQRVCLETIQQCLSLGGEHVMKEHIALLMVCADICQTSARAMSLGAESHIVLCHACSQICQDCAKSCASMGDEFMQICARICEECADWCARMSTGSNRSEEAA